MVLSQLCGKVILNVSFLDKHDGSSFCSLHEGARLERSIQGWWREKKVLPQSIRSSVIERHKVLRQKSLASSDGISVAIGNGGMVRQRGDYIV